MDKIKLHKYIKIMCSYLLYVVLGLILVSSYFSDFIIIAALIFVGVVQLLLWNSVFSCEKTNT